MTDQEKLDLLCTAQSELVDTYDKHREKLAETGAPDYVLALVEAERELVLAELSSRITDLTIKLDG